MRSEHRRRAPSLGKCVCVVRGTFPGRVTHEPSLKRERVASQSEEKGLPPQRRRGEREAHAMGAWSPVRESMRGEGAGRLRKQGGLAPRDPAVSCRAQEL